MSQIVVVTRQFDPGSDGVIARLSEAGNEVVRLNTDELPRDSRIELRAGAGGQGLRARIDLLGGRAIDSERVAAVWLRRPAPITLPPSLSPHERAFARQEMDHALQSLWASLDCFWMSPPDVIRAASWKLEQLDRAVAHGFAVPRTVVTTDAESVRAFLRDCGGRIVLKTLSDPFLAAPLLHDYLGGREQDVPDDERQLYTTLLEADDVEDLSGVELAPVLCQEYVPKAAEYRVTVVGRRAFVARVEPPAGDGRAVAWTRKGEEAGLSEGQLPPELVERVVGFVASYGLPYSAVDLVETPTGDIVFLENNPNGQFRFVEELVPTLPISEAIAATLREGAAATASGQAVRRRPADALLDAREGARA